MSARGPKRIPKTIYVAVAAAVLALVAGFTVGALTLGGFSSAPRQSSATNFAPASAAGVSFPLAELTMVTPSSVPATGACTAANLGTVLVPTALTNGANTTLCLSSSVGGFSTGDTIQILEVSWNSSAAVSTSFEVQVFVATSPSANDVVATSYVQTSATITSSETAIYAVDLTQSSDTAVGGYSVIVTQL